MKIKNLTLVLTLATASFFACTGDEPTGEIGQVEPHKSVDGGKNQIGNPKTVHNSLDSNVLTEIIFEGKKFDFGEVEAGEIVNHAFKFRNTGKSPLLISNVLTSCGCTKPEWPQDLIEPDSTGEIVVRLDTKNKQGKQFALIYVHANTSPKTTELVLTGFSKWGN